MSLHSQRKHKVLSREILDATQLSALGAVVAESAYLEHLIEKTIAYVARLSERDMEILVPKSSMLGAKINILEKLAAKKLRSNKKRLEFAKLMSDMKNNNTDRRNAVHGTWWFTEAATADNPPGPPAAKHASGATISAKSMVELADKISVTYWALLDFSILNWLAPARWRKQRRKLAKPRGSF